MVELDTNLDKYADKKTEIPGFYDAWESAMANWNLNNIATA